MGNNLVVAKNFFAQENIQSKFQEILGQKSKSFITSLLQVTSQNDMLKDADVTTVYTAAMMAATLDLPINNNLGFAYIVPFKNRKKGITEAQFQLGYKGFIQLAQRSGQFLTISAVPIYEGQIATNNPLTGIVFDFDAKTSNTIIGYASYFKLINGFEKTLYMTKEQIQNHASKYSQTYKRGYGVWKDQFDAMAEKTVLKLLLSKYAPLSTEMQKSMESDQAVIRETNNGFEYEYNDNESSSAEVVVERVPIQFPSEQYNQMKQAYVNGKISMEQITAGYELTPDAIDNLTK